MKQFLISFFGSLFGVVIGLLVFLVLIPVLIIQGLIAAAENAQPLRAPLEGPTVLELDLREPRFDQPSRSPFAFAEPLSTTEIVQALERAERDENVSGLFVRANSFGLSPGFAEEMRAAFRSFSESGKFVIAHAQGFEGTGVTAYFAVGGVDELWMQETSSFSAVGLASEPMFLGGFFEFVGAPTEFLQFYEYKNAANIYTESEFTNAHREATLSLLNSLFDSALGQLAEDRELAVQDLRDLIVSGPHSAEQAVQAGLADELGHVHEARRSAYERAGGNADTLSVAEYFREHGPSDPNSEIVIALIEGQGPIVTGFGDSGFGDPLLGSDYMAGAIDRAAEDGDVDAIVLRVDSPGGSAIASDQIADAVMRAQEAGKPVVISMASLAASGGYYIAAPADRIFALESTITGSIGVLGGKIVFDGALNNIGLNIEPLFVGGEYALAYSPATQWSDAQEEAFRVLMEDIYEDFTELVAEGRELPLSRVQEIARGRVWTGAQALDLGLVDEIGGLRAAIAAAAELAGGEAGDPVDLRPYPARPTPFEALQNFFGLSAEAAATLGDIEALMSAPELQAILEARRAADRQGVQFYAPVREPR